MNLNADFSCRVAVHGASLPWVASPMAGVERRMLDRVGGEVARATSIVRYARGSRFAPHLHAGGEEFLVLEGVFQDEHGDYPAGTYVRNPPQSSHQPGSTDGCIIFVKLWQFDPEDRRPVRSDTRAGLHQPDAVRAGVEILPLFRESSEDVRLERWAGGAEIHLALPAGGEFLVLGGGFEEGGEGFHPQSWLRMPPGAQLKARAAAQGCRLMVKTDHLAPPRGANRAMP